MSSYGVCPDLYGSGNERRRKEMAFVRWRGRCAQLIATIYEDGRSKQKTLTALPEFNISQQIRDEVAQKYPHIPVDWNQISRDFAKGPPEHLRIPTPVEHQDMAVIETLLRKWSREADNRKDAEKLWDAAIVLCSIRAQFYYKNEVPRQKG